MKKVFFSFIFVLILFNTSLARASDYLDLYQQVENESVICEEIKNMIEEAVLKGEIEPMNDYAYTYKEVKYPIEQKTISGYLPGLPPGGISMSSGGAVYVDLTANNKSISIYLQAPNHSMISISFNLPLGSVVNNITGYTVNIPPGDKFYRVYGTRTFNMEPFIIFRKYNYDSNSNWEIYYKNSFNTLFNERFDVHQVN